MTRMRVTGAHEISLRKDIIHPEYEEDVVSILKKGSPIDVDTSKTFWDWKDRQYYKAKSPSGATGYINVNYVTL